MGDKELKQQVFDFLENDTSEGFEEDPMPEGDEDIFGMDEGLDVEEEEEETSETSEEPEGESSDTGKDDSVTPPTDESGESGDSPDGNEDAGDEGAADGEGDVVSTLRNQIEELQASIAEMKKPQESGETGEADAKTMPIKDGEVLDFVGDQDLDELLSDKNKFNEFLSGVVNQVRNNTTEQVYRNLPQMVQTQVQSQNQLKTFVDEFYKQNEDLLPVRKTVGAVANEIAAEHPEYELNQLFSETEAKVRKMMGLKRDAQQAPESSKSRTESPALPQRGARRTGERPKKLSGQDKHIQDVL